MWKFTTRNPPPPLCRSRVTGIAFACRRWSSGLTRERRRVLFYNFFAAPDRPPSSPSTTPVLALFDVRPLDDLIGPPYLQWTYYCLLLHKTTKIGKKKENLLTSDLQRWQCLSVLCYYYGVAADLRCLCRTIKTPPEEWTNSWREYL